jgi:glyoxylate carboligase
MQEVWKFPLGGTCSHGQFTQQDLANNFDILKCALTVEPSGLLSNVGSAIVAVYDQMLTVQQKCDLIDCGWFTLQGWAVERLAALVRHGAQPNRHVSRSHLYEACWLLEDCVETACKLSKLHLTNS